MRAISNKIVSVIIIVLGISMLTGCSQMALKSLAESNKPIDLTENSIAIFSIAIDNAYNESWNPIVSNIRIESVDGTYKEHIGLNGCITRKMSDNDNLVNNSIVSVYLKPGSYHLTKIVGITLPYNQTGGAFFDKTFKYQFNIQPNEICCTGHVRFHSRKIQPGEKNSVSTLPIITYIISGIKDCYWEVQTGNDLYNDITYIKEAVPKIQSQIINIRIGQLLGQD